MRVPARHLALALPLLALTLKLLPPGWGDRAHPLDSTKFRMPGALARGSRGSVAPMPVMAIRAGVTPAPARLGQRLIYHGYVFTDHGVRVKFEPPAPGGSFSWGAPRTGHALVSRPIRGEYGSYTPDSIWIEIPLQVFETGAVSVPGLNVQLDGWGVQGSDKRARLPTVKLFVLPTVTASDTSAKLRPLHGPLGAPWWERVPWRVVLAAIAGLAAIIAGIRWLRRRMRRPVPAPMVAVRRVVRDPSAEALAELARLRSQGLPEQGRFGEHALALTRILRRFLEATVGTPRPGDTRPELLARLRSARLANDDLERLDGLLGLWDRVKFARAHLGVDEAGRCESAVESLVGRRETPREVA